MTLFPSLYVGLILAKASLGGEFPSEESNQYNSYKILFSFGMYTSKSLQLLCSMKSVCLVEN